MRSVIRPCSIVLVAMLVLSVQARPARAEVFPRFVAGNGVDGPNCGAIGVPCRTLQAAINNVGAKGEIICLDAGSYGPATITKSLSIVCDHTTARVDNTGVDSVGITISAGASDVVTLSGLDFEGSVEMLAAIVFISGAALHVHKVEIRNFRGDDTGAVVRDSVLAGSQADGVFAASQTGTASVSVLVDGVKAATNFGSGVRAFGTAASGQGSAVVRINNSTIANNVFGVSTGGAGRLESFKNNVISGNLTDGTPIPTFPGPGGTPLQ